MKSIGKSIICGSKWSENQSKLLRHEINPYNSSGVQEKHLDCIGLRISTMYHKAHWLWSEQEAYDLSNMSLPSSPPPGPAARSHHVNHSPCNASRSAREKIGINCGSEWIRSSYYPGISHPSHSPRSHTLLTKDQNLISRKSDSWPPRETRGPDRDPIEEPPGQIINTAFGHLHCCGRWRETRPLPRIHNGRSTGISHRVPVQHFLLSNLLFIILISLAASHSHGSFSAHDGVIKKSAEKQWLPFKLLIAVIDMLRGARGVHTGNTQWG